MSQMNSGDVHAIMRAALMKVGTRPEIIYAFDKTGRIVTEDNREHLTADDLAAWHAAIEEYRRLHPEE